MFKRNLLFTMGLALLLTAAGPVHAQNVNERLSRMEKELKALRQENASRAERETALQTRINELEGQVGVQADSLSNAIESLDGITAGAGAASALSVGGYFDIEFKSDDTKSNNTFDQHRFILSFDGSMNEWISFRAELEIEGGGAEASFLSGNEIVLEYGELHFNFDEAINLKAGALLVPFGRFNALHDAPLRDLTDRPLVDRRIVPTTWTDAGVGLYGAFNLGNSFRLDYDFVLINGLDDDFSGTPGGGMRDSRNSFRSDNNDNKMFVGRVGLTPDFAFLDALNVGVSFGWGKYDASDTQAISMFGLDWTAKKGPFEFIGEWAMIDLERGAAQIAAGVPGGADGWYIQGNYHFFPESWRSASKFFGDESTFTLVARYGTMDTDDSATGIDRAATARGDAFRDDAQRFTLGLNFRPIEKTVFKIEYQWWFEADGIADADNDRFVMSFATFF